MSGNLFHGDNGNPIGSSNPLPIASTTGIVLSVASSAITSTKVSANLTVGSYKELAVDVNISAITGTTPSYQVKIDRLGADGIWYNIYSGTALTATGPQSVNLGVGASTNVSFGSTIRVQEVVTGTTPSVTRTVSIIGK